MEPIEVLTDYFLSEMYYRYRRLVEIPEFGAVHAPTLKERLKKQSGTPEEFADVVEKHFQCLESMGGQLICLGDPRYPSYLRHIKDPPLAINVVGNPNWFDAQMIAAVIGSRKAPPFSLRQSFELGQAMARENIVVVSGGAYGCDIAAHHGCLSTGISPLGAVVVLAGGVDQFYPQVHRDVFKEIISVGGCIMSERLCGHRPRNFDFPIRNRIIAGMGASVYVVSAGKRSGAMITARLALDSGRDVYVLQPEQQDVRHDGIKDLLFDGAQGFESVSTLIENGYGYS